jgi:hypothetical protein
MIKNNEYMQVNISHAQGTMHLARHDLTQKKLISGKVPVEPGCT